MKNMDFGDALKHIKKGGCASREVWNRKKRIETDGVYIVMTTAGPESESRLWKPTHEDMLANDWHTIAIGIAA